MDPSRPTRRLARSADAVRDRLAAAQAERWGVVGERVGLLVQELDRLRRAGRRLATCAARAWRGAANRVARDAQQVLANLPYLQGQVEAALADARRTAPSLGDVLAELQAAEAEFGELRRHGRRRVSVVTEPIELEGVYLGEFEIQVQIDELGGPCPYRAVALDPSPAAANDDVTHPHISSDRLCAGDATAPIRQALADGRLCDFFMLVRGVLETYNADSPYVSLEDWRGQSCHDCATTVAQGDTCLCESCENDFCEECISYCRQCERTVCRGCLATCSHCGELHCERCMDVCSECEEACCVGCLDDGLCPSCLEALEDENEQDQDKADEADERTSDADGAPGRAEAGADAAVQPHGVGQAAVLLPS